MPNVNVLLPQEIDLDKSIALNSTYNQARVDIKDLPRLLDSCERVAGDVLVDLSFEEDLNGMRLIHGHVTAAVVLICQRCGQEYLEHLDLIFDLSPDLKRAQSYHLEDKYDFFDSIDDSKIDIYTLVEDSLIIEIPSFPKHEENSPDCSLAGNHWSYGECSEEEKINPFAALASLKGQLKSGEQGHEE